MLGVPPYPKVMFSANNSAENMAEGFGYDLQEKEMIRFLIASTEKDFLADFASALNKNDDVKVFWAESGSKALDIISEKKIGMVITDEDLSDMTGLEFAAKLVSTNPMINCAAVSSLLSEKFHEASEGLGLLMQLPVNPGKEDAELLLQHLKKILHMTENQI